MYCAFFGSFRMSRLHASVGVEWILLKYRVFMHQFVLCHNNSFVICLVCSVLHGEFVPNLDTFNEYTQPSPATQKKSQRQKML